jgi:predicted small lipoprotein YifL
MRRLFLLAALLAVAACGIKGEPEPPEDAVADYPGF